MNIMLFMMMLQMCTATAAVVAEDLEDGCHCHTELNLTIPPCLCTGTVEAVQEVYKLKQDIRELRDNCSTCTDLAHACELGKTNKLAILHKINNYYYGDDD